MISIFKQPLARVHLHDIWISELLTRIFVSLYSGLLILMLILIGFNFVRIQRIEHRLTFEKSAARMISAQHDSLSTRLQILRGIRFLRGRPLPGKTVSLLADIVQNNSSRFGYDPFLLLAVIHVESRFDKAALGKFRSGELSGAMGLMQLKFETAQEMAQRLKIDLKKPEDLFNPEINIPLGIYYLTRMVIEFESLPLGILAYNQGPGTVMKSVRGELPLSEAYYHRVMKSYYTLKREVGPGDS